MECTAFCSAVKGHNVQWMNFITQDAAGACCVGNTPSALLLKIKGLRDFSFHNKTKRMSLILRDLTAALFFLPKRKNSLHRKIPSVSPTE